MSNTRKTRRHPRVPYLGRERDTNFVIGEIQRLEERRKKLERSIKSTDEDDTVQLEKLKRSLACVNTRIEEATQTMTGHGFPVTIS